MPSDLLRALYEGDAVRAAELRAACSELDVFEAAALGEVDQLRRHLDQVDAWSDDGFTPLHYAAFFGQANAARALIEAGADIEARSRNTEFALDARPLHSAAAGGQHEVCRVLLEAGADSNAEQHGGFTPLRQAEQNEDADLAALLREHGATA